MSQKMKKFLKRIDKLFDIDIDKKFKLVIPINKTISSFNFNAENLDVISANAKITYKDKNYRHIFKLYSDDEPSKFISRFSFLNDSINTQLCLDICNLVLRPEELYVSNIIKHNMYTLKNKISLRSSGDSGESNKSIGTGTHLTSNLYSIKVKTFNNFEKLYIESSLNHWIQVMGSVQYCLRQPLDHFYDSDDKLYTKSSLVDNASIGALLETKYFTLSARAELIVRLVKASIELPLTRRCRIGASCNLENIYFGSTKAYDKTGKVAFRYDLDNESRLKVLFATDRSLRAKYKTSIFNKMFFSFTAETMDDDKDQRIKFGGSIKFVLKK